MVRSGRAVISCFCLLELFLFLLAGALFAKRVNQVAGDGRPAHVNVVGLEPGTTAKDYITQEWPEMDLT